MELPTNFTRDVIMKAPTADIMNSMTRSILTLASYDKDKDNLELSNVLRQCMMLISTFPMMAAYAYHAYNHYENNGSMYIHRPDPELSIAENFLRMIRPDQNIQNLKQEFLILLYYFIWNMVVVITQPLQQELLLLQVQIHIQLLLLLCHH